MESESNIQHEVEKTMQSLDGIEPAKTDDFFYSRLEEHLNNRNRATKYGFLTELIRKPALSFAMVAVFVLSLFNVFTIIEYQQQGSREVEETREAYIEVFAKEYGLQIPTIYQLNDD